MSQFKCPMSRLLVFSLLLLLKSELMAGASVQPKSSTATDSADGKIQNAAQFYKFRVANEKNKSTPKAFTLFQNYPNPFNNRTFIKFVVITESKLTIDIFDAQGGRVSRLISTNLQPGTYLVPWDATNDAGNTMNSGVYFVRVMDEDTWQVRRLLLLR